MVITPVFTCANSTLRVFTPITLLEKILYIITKWS